VTVCPASTFGVLDVAEDPQAAVPVASRASAAEAAAIETGREREDTREKL
jgi:hypothetical protein